MQFKKTWLAKDENKPNRARAYVIGDKDFKQGDQGPMLWF
jgi:hypothetical protein